MYFLRFFQVITLFLYKYSKIEKTLKMKVGIIQMACDNDNSQNLIRLKEKINIAAEKGAELVVLQELHNSIYFCQVEDTNNFDLAETIPGKSTSFFGEIARKNKIVIVTSLFEKRSPGIYHNTSVVIEKNGDIAGIYRKMHIPDDPAYYEKFYFTSGDLGFHPIKTSVGILGVQICWDQWFPEGARLMALQGAQLLIYPTAIGFESMDSQEEQLRQKNAWKTIQRGHAIANGLHVIAVNRCGYEKDPSGLTNGIKFWGTSFMAGPQGEIIYESPENKEDIAVIDINIDRTEEVRRWWPFLRDRRIDEYKDISKRFID